MRDGLFYIGDAASKKVLQFTSYGDLLSVYYNPEATPPPDFSAATSAAADPFSAQPSEEGEAESRAITKRAIEYPFNRISAVAADSVGRLFVADALPNERAEYSEKDDLLLENIVIRFDAQGRFIDYLGQEGPGGTPFSAISGIYISSDDELFVVALRQDGAEVFWYNGAGMLLYRVPVFSSFLPSPYAEGEESISVLTSVIPARHGGTIYLKIDYYREETDAETGSQSGIAFDRSVLYPFFIEQASFGDFADLPSCEIEEGAIQSSQAIIPYSMIGVTESDKVFLCAPVPQGYELCVVDLHTRRIQRRALAVSAQEQLYNVFNLSSTGILSALLAGADEASVVWWRADTL